MPISLQPLLFSVRVLKNLLPKSVISSVPIFWKQKNLLKKDKGIFRHAPQKNPITAERVAGLSRVLRGNAMASLENVALWHERDITHSSVERIILPDSCLLFRLYAPPHDPYYGAYRGSRR